MPTDVRIHVAAADVARPEAWPQPSNDGREWRVVLPATATEGTEATVERSRWTFGVVFGILQEASLMPHEELLDVLERAMRKTGLGNFLIGRSYEQLAADFAPNPDPFAAILLRPVPRTLPSPLPSAHAELAWVGGPGPGYSERGAEEMARRRYDHAVATWPFTLARLRASEEFQTTVAELRNEGWKDWHILLAAGNLATNYRLAAILDPFELPDKQLVHRVAYEPEAQDEPGAPIEDFGAEALRQSLRFTMRSTLEGYGLEARQRTPDLTAAERFLRERYNYWDIDAEHEEVF